MTNMPGHGTVGEIRGAWRHALAQPVGTFRRRSERLPPSDNGGAFERRGVAGQAREVAAYLDDGRKRAVLPQDTADGIGSRLIDGEHAESMARRQVMGK